MSGVHFPHQNPTISSVKLWSELPPHSQKTRVWFPWVVPIVGII